eukprot:scaffold162294_cov20-Prasinocladus_malaysianus.AAC.1
MSEITHIRFMGRAISAPAVQIHWISLTSRNGEKILQRLGGSSRMRPGLDMGQERVPHRRHDGEFVLLPALLVPLEGWLEVHVCDAVPADQNEVICGTKLWGQKPVRAAVNLISIGVMGDITDNVIKYSKNNRFKWNIV